MKEKFKTREVVPEDIQKCHSTANHIFEHNNNKEFNNESEQLYYAMFVKNKTVNLIIDPIDGSILDANPAACNFYGYSLSQFRSANIRDINTLSPEQIQQEMTAAVLGNRSYFNFRHLLANGDKCDVEVYSSPITIGGRTLLHSIIHDISERTRVEEILMESKARLKRAELLSKSGNWELHLNSNKIIASEGAIKIYGLKSRQIEYAEIKKIALPMYRSILDRSIKKLIEN